jgi:tetratricopeptide (TPR) repeat protein
MSIEQDEAIARAEMMVDHHPSDPEKLAELGWTYFYQHRYDEAIAAARRAIELAPGSAELRQLLGRAYLDAGQVEPALAALQAAIVLDPGFVEPYVSLGVLYSWQLGDYGAALEAFAEALSLEPQHAWANAQMGYTYACMGQPEEAVAWLQETLRRQPDNERALENLSMVYLSQQRYKDVVATCRRHAALNDRVNDPHRMMGYAYGQLGLHEEAIVELATAVELSPHIYEIRGALARELRAVGRDEEAAHHYAIAAAQAASDDDFGQASFAAVNGEVDRALTLLDAAMAKGQTSVGWLRIDPDLERLRDYARFRVLISG